MGREKKLSLSRVENECVSTCVNGREEMPVKVIHSRKLRNGHAHVRFGYATSKTPDRFIFTEEPPKKCLKPIKFLLSLPQPHRVKQLSQLLTIDLLNHPSASGGSRNNVHVM